MSRIEVDLIQIYPTWPKSQLLTHADLCISLWREFPKTSAMSESTIFVYLFSSTLWELPGTSHSRSRLPLSFSLCKIEVSLETWEETCPKLLCSPPAQDSLASQKTTSGPSLRDHVSQKSSPSKSHWLTWIAPKTEKKSYARSAMLVVISAFSRFYIILDSSCLKN